MARAAVMRVYIFNNLSKRKAAPVRKIREISLNATFKFRKARMKDVSNKVDSREVNTAE